MINISFRRQGGFTLIELILVIAFLGTLMLLATASLVQAINMYNKGSAIKQINQAGRVLIEDINRLSSSGAEVEIDDNGSAGCLRVGFNGGENRVFLWNSRAEGGGGTAPQPTTDRKWQIGGNPDAVTLVQSAQGTDTTRYCYLPSTTESGDLDTAGMTPVLSSNIRVLSVDITNSADSSLKKIAFWIGTGTLNDDGQQLIMTGTPTTWSCPGGALGEFCAVSKFETVIYTPNQGGTP